MIKKLAGTVLAAGALLVLVAPAAVAAAPEAFTITESLDLNTGDFSFTATGALCQSGTFEEEPFSIGGKNAPIHEHPIPIIKRSILIRTVYTCDDGDTFFAQKHVEFVEHEDGSFTNTGPIALQGGTGTFAGLSGHGVDNGTGTAGGIAVGEISGVLKLR
jgi:hypothetical protein